MLSLTSLSVSERKFSLVKSGCLCSIYTWGAEIYLGIMLCGVWYGVPNGVVDNFGLFQTGSRCSNLAKFRRFVKFNQDRLVVRNPVLCCLFWSGWSHGGL